jgi:hypothetical protein
MIHNDALMSWWERMTDDRRSELLAHRNAPIRPDLALELWQDSGWLPVVRPGRWSDDVHRLAWRFAPEVEDLLAAVTADHTPRAASA